MACRDYNPMAGLSLPPEDVDRIMVAMGPPLGPVATTPNVAAPAPAKPSVSVTPAGPSLTQPRPTTSTTPPKKAQPGILGPLVAGAGTGLLIGGPVGLVIGAASGLAVGFARQK